MEVDSQPTAPKRVQELWFEDGNIVIQAGNSQYRVFRGILATHSPVFLDMLSFPQPPDSEVVEDCPLVRLQDKEVEVTPFLRAIFDSSYFMPHPASTKFDILVGILRLSHKYEVDYLRRRALIHLSSAYRTKLSEYDAALYDESDPRHPPSEVRSWICPGNDIDRITTIQLAHEVDTPWILPIAFYALSSSHSELGRHIFHGIVKNGVSACLTDKDQQILAEGHGIQITSTVADIVRFLYHPLDIEGCTSSKTCIFKRLQAMENNRANFRVNAALPLEVWGEEEWTGLANLCPACLTVLKQVHQEARQAFWDRLPSMYELPEWEELERLRAAAIGTNIFS
ncbi:hypothetical protein B0H13DRAFT_1701192 [Mycena leptocephala]|nr:hypothetical protein B0H13DRAFT_1701192 [Mycena leptocephala]